MSFKSVMQKIGEDAKVVLEDVVKYLPEATSLATVIFPPSVAITAPLSGAINLIQKTVAVVEQKFAASGTAAKTGTAKLSDVLSIVGPAVIDALNKENIPTDTTYVTNIINAVVAILNVKAAS